MALLNNSKSPWKSTLVNINFWLIVRLSFMREILCRFCPRVLRFSRLCFSLSDAAAPVAAGGRRVLCCFGCGGACCCETGGVGISGCDGGVGRRTSTGGGGGVVLTGGTMG